MMVRSALGRLAITLPFFGTAMVVLALFGNPTASLSPEPDSALILIVTNEALNPAFEELESWNRSQGCRSALLTPDMGTRNEQRFVEELGARVSPMPPDLALGRVSVGNLDEAWAFVEACRESGETLDRLFGRTVSQDMATALPAGTTDHEVSAATFQLARGWPRP